MTNVERENTCFFTGHRRLKKGSRGEVIEALDKTIKKLSDRGFTNFVCGGAIGFDTVAACRVVVAARKDERIRLILALPCRDQTLRWKDSHDVALYQRIKGYADEIMYAADFYKDGCMLARNRMMADMSSLCVAYYDGGRGGTAYSVRYAEKNGLEVMNIYDEL